MLHGLGSASHSRKSRPERVDIFSILIHTLLRLRAAALYAGREREAAEVEKDGMEGLVTF